MLAVQNCLIFEKKDKSRCRQHKYCSGFLICYFDIFWISAEFCISVNWKLKKWIFVSKGKTNIHFSLLEGFSGHSPPIFHQSSHFILHPPEFLHILIKSRVTVLPALLNLML